MIPKVVASEMGKAQTVQACLNGVVGPDIVKLQKNSLAEWCGKANQRR